MTRSRHNPIRRAFSLLLPLLGLAAPALAQGLGDSCTATLLNHSIQVNSDGTYNLPNVPVNPGLYRIHVVCVNPDGTTSGGQSDPVAFVPNGAFTIPLISIGPIPTALAGITVNAGSTLLTTRGATTQLNVIATLADGTSQNYTADTATTFTSSNPNIATVDPTGLLTAVGAGVVTVTARNDGLVATVSININALIDTDGDGIPDAWEIAHGLNPYDPTDAALDPDNDGLTNLQEYQAGTDPHVADTDGDGLSDGQEVKLGTNPLLADTDGDGLTDGQEVSLGTNPLLADTDGDGIPDGLEVKLGTNPLVADPTTTVTARVIDGSNKPIAGAAATVLLYFTATTDATGSFTILHVPTDVPSVSTLAATVLANMSGTVQNGISTPAAPVAGGITDLGVIQLGAATGVVTGTVVSTTGKLVAGAQVTVTSSTVTLSTTTSASGVYTVTNLPTGTITVAVLDPATGLRGQVTGTMVPASNGGGALTLNVILRGLGTVSGTVLTAAGAPAPAGVTVGLSGSTILTTTTGPLGAYTFPFVPLGAFVVQASDAAGDTGSSSGFVANTNETITANIQFLGNGTVTGRVADAANNPAANATVTLLNTGTTPQKLTTTTDSSGNYTLTGVFVGSFAVSAGSMQMLLGGTTMASLTQQGQTLTVNITLTAAGTAHGLVTRHDGITPAAGVTVRAVNNALSTITDSTGAYTLALIPAGPVTLMATDPATSDQGSIATTITASTTTQVPNLVLNGVGTVHVTVTDASGAAVPAAQLTLTSSSAFAQQLTGLSASDGTYTFLNALAGPITVMATNPANQLAGTAQATATSGGTVDVAVQLQPAGTISGTVFASDGQTPAAGVTVQLDSATTTVSASNGTYQFATVPAGTHLVVALDGQQTATSPTVTVNIASQGQVATANLTLIARATVTGTISNADGTPASGASVSAQSLTAGFVRSLNAQADVNGAYSIPNLPVGPIRVAAYSANASAQANASLAATGSAVNLTLVANQISSAQTLYDADAIPYDLDAAGEIATGLNSVFAGIGNTAAQSHSDTLLLTLESTGTQYPFAGQTFATTLQNGQEIAIEQDGLAGLNVTRRVYVPSNGYLARYLEVLTNPTSSDITVTVGLRSGFRYSHETRNGYDYQGIPQVKTTSSGDSSFNITTTPSTTDHWVVEGVDQDVDPFLDTATVPAVGYLFDDGNGQVSLTSGDFFSDSRHGQLDAAWQHIRVPANSTVEFLHFTAPLPHALSAQNAMQRLIQLPPEALFGLSASDAAAIQNFHVPTNLTSTLPALPLLTGSVIGNVIASDNVTPIPAAIVSLQSSDPIFSRTYQFRAYSDGSFNFTGNADPSVPSTSQTVAVPLENFNLSAVNPATGITSPTFLGGLSPSLTVAAQSIVLSNTGQQQGTVTFNGNNIVTNGTVTLTSGALAAPLVLTIQPDGTYSVTGLPVGQYTATANITGTFLTGVVTTTITSGAAITANILINAGGILTGQVLGSDANHTPLANITVYLRLGTQTLTAITSSTGSYTFTDVPAGSYTVQTYDPISNTAASVPVTLTSAGTTTQNLTLSSTGSVNVQLAASSGSLSGIPVTLTPSSGGATLTATSNSTGLAAFTGVPVGSFTVAASAPNGFSGTATGALGLAGQTASLTLTIGAHGTASGTVFQADGVTPAPNIQVQLYGVPPGGIYTSLLSTTTTNASGAYTFNTVPVGGFNVYAGNAANGDAGDATGNIAVANQQVTVNISLTGLGTVTVTVLNGNQSPDPGVQVTVRSVFNSSYSATTNAQGVATLSKVLAGSVIITATDPLTQLSGNATVALAANGTAAATITLQSTENVTGHVYQAGSNRAPAAGAALQIYLFGTRYPAATTTSKSDGSYTFSGLPLGTYVINVSDANGVFRTYANLTLNAAGQTATQDFTYTGLGTVKGVVSNPDGTAASGIGVSLTSQSPIGGNLSTQADNSGNYTITNVPAGAFTVSAQDLSRGVGATATGTVTSDGDIETVNLQLVSNVVSLTKTLTDFNNFPYDIQANGSIANGVFVNDPLRNRGYFESYNNAFQLSLYQNGTPTSFNGASTAITTLNGRQLAIQQVAPIDGLTVTRKVFVPSDGYFTRYLETLSNPTSSPITVDVQVTGGLQYPYPNAINLTTSSGDAALSTADTTLVTNSAPTGFPYPYNQPSLGEAFQGPNAPTPIAVATYVTPNSTNNLYYPQLTYRWNAVTIPANGQVAFLHFATQQTTQAQAVASVARLDQLPPEGLYGLTSAELASITNFAVPAGGTSQLQPLTVPAQGSVTGHVYATDAATAIPGAEVIVSGNNLYLGNTQYQLADANGQFNFVSFPQENYTLTAVDPHSYVVSPATPGSFTAPSLNSSQNIAFTNTGTLSGTVTAPTGTTYTSANALLVNSFGSTVTTASSVNPDGTFLIPDVLPGTYTLQLNAYPSLAPSQGTAFFITQSVTIAAGQTTAATVALPQTGTLTGVFTNAQGQPEANAYVDLQSSTVGRTQFTDANGNYTFPQVPYGTYTLTGYESSTSLTATANVTVASPTLTQNLQIASGGTINLTVTYSTGAPAPNSLVTVSRANLYNGLTVGVTDANGKIQITNQPIGNFTVTAYYPGQPQSTSSLYTTVTGAVAGNGQTLTATAAFPATGTISGIVTTYSGTPVANAQVVLNYTNSSTAPYRNTATSSSTGAYSFSPVVSGLAAQLLANTANNYQSGSSTAITTPASGATLTQNLKLPVAANVNIIALDGNNNPIPNDYIDITATTQPTTSTYPYGNDIQTGSTGVAQFTGVPDAAYSVILYNSNFKIVGSTTFTVHLTDDGKTLSVVVQTGFTGTISGTLVAADGQTPVPASRYASVSIFDKDTNETLASYQSTDGTYTFPNLTVGRDGYTLMATYGSPAYTFPTVSASNIPGALTADGQTQTVNITLPIPVLTGTVYQNDGVTPAPNPSVTVTANNLGNPISFYGISDATGAYAVALPVSDQVTVLANAAGLTTVVPLTINGSDTIDTQNITLAPSGTVTGKIVDLSGAGIPYDQITVTTDGGPYALTANTATDGTYTVLGVALGNITVTIDNYCTATGTGVLANNNDTLTVNLTVDTSQCGGPSPSRASATSQKPKPGAPSLTQRRVGFLQRIPAFAVASEVPQGFSLGSLLLTQKPGFSPRGMLSYLPPTTLNAGAHHDR